MYKVGENDPGDVPVVVGERKACGCGPCHPRCLAPLARPAVFSVLMALILIVELAAINGYIGAITSTLEKQFLLSSSEVGAISIINDLVSLLVVGIFTYFGHSAHRPRVVGTGALLVGVGTAICALPHFTTDSSTGSFTTNASQHRVCGESENTTSFGNNAPEKSRYTSLYLFIIGQIVVGVGNAPIIPLAMTYVDDAVEKHKTTAYIAVIYIGTSVGPMVGFLVSSWTLSLYVDLDTIPRDEWPAVPRNDPRWIGAWWLGLLVLGSAMVLLALPLFLFPRRLGTPIDEPETTKSSDVAGLRCNGVELRGASDRREKEEGFGDEHKSETKKFETEISRDQDKMEKFESKESSRTLMGQVKDFLSALLRLGRNLTLVALALGLASELAIVSGLTTFGAKYTETQFGVSAGQAALLTGAAILPASCAGHLLAGAFLRRFRLTAFQCSVFLCITVLVTLCIYPVLMFLGCDTPTVVSPKSTSCTSSQCVCDDTVIDPVCGVDGLTYLSPCLAGCVGRDEENKTFSDCSCIQGPGANSSSTEDESEASWEARVSACPLFCTMMVAYIATSSMALFVMFMGQNPSMIINLRCVEEKDRSFAIGMLTCVIKVIGFFPAPVYFGAVIKSTCLLYASSEGAVLYEETANSVCWHYDLLAFRRRFFGLLIGLKSCTLIFFLITMASLWRKRKEEVQTEEQTDKRRHSASSETSSI
ncbi:solute carrier organic anion transporter family member 2A1-like [Patiria miniata]|uniref:Solute carrier organic anion transporter family member n=1 Tax=Patiria miniata TaxID=46514 RepID=A0A913Z0H7_PATMI|nr:solute carrier organic anion transporter family member 2A1-like [Patiria miniata]